MSTVDSGCIVCGGPGSDDTESDKWKNALLDLFDRLGTESWPYVDKTPTEVQNALYEHVNWLVGYEKGCLKYRLARKLLDECGDYDIVLRQDKSNGG